MTLPIAHAGHWLLGIGCALSVLYIPYVFDDLAFRVGNPSTPDVVMGSILFLTLLEATRRSMGWPLPLIAIGLLLKDESERKAELRRNAGFLKTLVADPNAEILRWIRTHA